MTVDNPRCHCRHCWKPQSGPWPNRLDRSAACPPITGGLSPVCPRAAQAIAAEDNWLGPLAQFWVGNAFRTGKGPLQEIQRYIRQRWIARSAQIPWRRRRTKLGWPHASSGWQGKYRRAEKVPGLLSKQPLNSILCSFLTFLNGGDQGLFLAFYIRLFSFRSLHISLVFGEIQLGVDWIEFNKSGVARFTSQKLKSSLIL